MTEFVRWHYNNIQKELSFSFTNDSKIILGGNIPAWKIEYNYSALGSTFDIKTLENRPENKTTNHIDILTIVNGTYYIIAYSGFAYPDPFVPGKDGDFSKFLSVQNDMIRSVHFIPVRQITAAEIPSYVPPTPKKPSFMQP